MVHPVGFAGYGFQAAEGLAAMRIALLGDLLFWVREPQSQFGKGMVNRS